MALNSAQLIYFSPTRTTKRILEAISQGLRAVETDHVDLTPPETETHGPQDSWSDLAVIGAPVYAGRLPAAMLPRFRRLQGNGAPAVIVVVYGNRAYEDALLELRDLALEGGFRPIAAGAFVGEHSFSTDATPIAVGRPDAEDVAKARSFGEMVRAKMAAIRNGERIGPLRVPGNFPYKELQMLSDIAPALHGAVCTGCRNCLPFCPTSALRADNPAITDKGLCIKCCACVKACPSGARTMDDARIREIAERLSANCRARKEPETYF